MCPFMNTSPAPFAAHVGIALVGVTVGGWQSGHGLCRPHKRKGQFEVVCGACLGAEIDHAGTEAER